MSYELCYVLSEYRHTYTSSSHFYIAIINWFGLVCVVVIFWYFIHVESIVIDVHVVTNWIIHLLWFYVAILLCC